jgi:aryl-alcohol dehydrogenase-like predicted oxidoreductase
MKVNRLGSSDIYLSELTLGCMSLGKDYKHAKSIIDTALDQGINHLDTADLYDFGLNEEIIGSVIKDKRQDIILTTKAGNHFSKETKDWFWDPSKEYIIKAVKDSLKRLETDYIDFFMLHGGTIEDPIDETIEAMEELKRDGLIRAYGISSIRPNVIQAYIDKASIDGVMLQYSILDRRPEEEILDLLDDNNISAIARGPLAKGILSSDYQHKTQEKMANGFMEYSQHELYALLEKIEKLSPDLSVQEIAFKYILKHPAVSTITFGASSKKQVLENTKLDLSTPLDESIYQQLQAITKDQFYQEHRRS